MSNGLEDFSLLELFRMEAEEQVRVLQSRVIELESGAAMATTLEALMRASHSLKGAARIVGLDAVVHLTHAMEDRFVAAQGGLAIDSSGIDVLLAATDWLAKLQVVSEAEMAGWLDENLAGLEGCAAALRLQMSPEIAADPEATAPATTAEQAEQTEAATTPAPPALKPAARFAAKSAEPAAKEEDIFAQPAGDDRTTRERTVRMTADRFDQLLALSGETLVAARKLSVWGESLEHNHRALHQTLALLEDSEALPGARTTAHRELSRQVTLLASHLADLEQMSRANETTVERLYRAVLGGRLRPFSEGITGVARLVRDTARELGKQVRLEVEGESTRVDRDILDRLEAPISHLVTNAIDHGIETPERRAAIGKQAEARLRIHARHENGRLVITVRDDGQGIAPERIRERVIQRNLAPAESAAGMSEAELLEFLFLPGFSTKETANVISGRGVGLNVVQSMVQEAGGSVVVLSTEGEGTVFRLTLPVTRSVIRAIRVLVEGELYSIPLVRIDRVEIVELDGETERPVARWDDRDHPVISLASILGLSDRAIPKGPVSLVFSGGFAFAVDRLLEQAELSVRRLDPRLGKIPGISAASLDESGFPLLILDMDDLIQTAKGKPPVTAAANGGMQAPHILVVDDSHTVREMERRLLVKSGYTVSTAQNGQEAWNLLRMNDYELLISDVDMPQMNGIELVARTRENPRLARMPVIILSYKDREEDRKRGLDAGADYYLTKGSFDNGSFLQAVVDLIGEAGAVGEGDCA
jgi:two-component system sensor histidine kinase and response regulator WspE